MYAMIAQSHLRYKNRQVELREVVNNDGNPIGARGGNRYIWGGGGHRREMIFLVKKKMLPQSLKSFFFFIQAQNINKKSIIIDNLFTRSNLPDRYPVFITLSLTNLFGFESVIIYRLSYFRVYISLGRN